ncbi:MAG: mechanosensitive ion channel [Spirulina sp. SIO3F2]|nr:mechanosensitive ion channel [Spirulina sp. SIO3F2]
MIRRLLWIRAQAILTTGLISVVAVFSVPALSQESEDAAAEEPSSILVESTIVGDVDPSKAVTVDDITVPVDQLELLLQPLTLEELQTEAAAWFLLLKDKVQEISKTEVAIKRQNALIQQEEDAAKAVEDAKELLAKAEEKLAETEQGTPAHEAATKKLEEAKQALLEANQSVEAVLTTKEDLESDEDIKEAIAEAEVAEEINKDRKILEEAQQEREKLEAGSAAYQDATAKIDALNIAITELETAEEKRETAVPESPEYQELSKVVEQAQAKVIAASKAIIQAGLAPSAAQAETEVKSEEADEALEGVASDVEESQEAAVEDAPADDAEGTAETAEGDVAEEQPNETEAAQTPEEAANEAGEAAEQLEAVDETLANVAEAEADLKNQLVINVTELQGERTALIDRFNAVLDELDAKGGDTQSYRLYIEAVSGIELDITDTEGLGFRIVTWLKSEEGGIRLGLHLLKFAGIIAVALVLSPIAGNVTDKSLSKMGGVSNLLRGFAVTLVRRGVITIGVLFAVTTLGISLGPLLAVVGGASFVLAFALQSNLGNFASGLMLLAYKPFDVGDRVKIPGTSENGYVRSITLANTSFDHYTGKIVTIPNATVWGSRLENLLPTEYRLIEFLFMVGSDVDSRKIKEVWDKIAAEHPGIVEEKWNMAVPFISPSSGSLMYWCGGFAYKKGFWTVYEEVLLQMWDGLKEAGIPFGVDRVNNKIWLANPQMGEEGITIDAIEKLSSQPSDPTTEPHGFVEPDAAGD